MAFKIEHEDRVILDTFHKQAKLLTALPQLFGSSIERNVQLSDLPLHRLLWHFRLLSASPCIHLFQKYPSDDALMRPKMLERTPNEGFSRP
jgi:hypothetical protein